MPQGSVIEPLIYFLDTNDILVLQQTTVAKFADGTALINVSKDFNSATQLQDACKNNWLYQEMEGLIKWDQVGESTFIINGMQIPKEEEPKYLSFTPHKSLHGRNIL